MNKHVALTRFGLTALCITICGAAALAAPSSSEQFSASANSSGHNAPPAVFGNPNCPPPVMPSGIVPGNWSCKTGTQGVPNGNSAGGKNGSSLRQVLLGVGTAVLTSAPSRAALLGKPDSPTLSNSRPNQQQAPTYSSAGMPAWPTEPQPQTPRPAMPSAGAGTNARLQAGFDRLNNSPRMQIINAVAGAVGARPLVAAPQGSTVGTQFGYSAQHGQGFGGSNLPTQH